MIKIDPRKSKVTVYRLRDVFFDIFIRHKIRKQEFTVVNFRNQNIFKLKFQKIRLTSFGEKITTIALILSS